MTSARHQAPLAALLIAFAVLLPGCDGSGPTALSAGPAPSAGDWQGTTEQGKTLAFSVGGTARNPRVTSYEIAIRIDMLTPGTGCLSSELTANGPASVPIVDRSFVVDISGINGAAIRFEGEFDSTTSASGLLTVDVPPSAPCPGRGVARWTAARV